MTARKVEHMYVYTQNMYTEKSAQHFTIAITQALCVWLYLSINVTAALFRLITD